MRPLTVSDVIEPVAANRDLQSLAIEQIKYPRLLRPVAVVAYGDSGRITDLTGLVDGDGRLNWHAPERSIVYALFSGSHGKLVERAAPGGEGYVIDHFSRNAIRSYLARFDRAFDSHPPVGLRAFFNDSYEVDDATGQGNWTPMLLDEFQKRRGYDLRRHLPALLGAGNTDLDIRDAHGLSGDDLRSAARNLYDRVGRVGPQPRTRRAKPGARVTRRICSTSTPKAISLRPRGPKSGASSGRPPRRMSRDAGSSRRRRPHGWANTSGRRSPTSARPSITSSSAASTTSSITARPTRPTRRRGPDGSSMPRLISTVAMPGGTTSPL